MLVNFSNHPSCQWGNEQIAAAEPYGHILDIPFPAVSPDASRDELLVLADQYVQQILSMGEAFDLTVHVMGEMTFVYLVVCLLKAKGVVCVASTTERRVKALPDGRKISEFQFMGFRQYG